MLDINPIKALGFALRFACGGAFLVAGLLKLRDPAAFAEQIANYQFAPEFANYLATLLPPLEILSGLVLILLKGKMRWAAAAVLIGLLLAFTSALARAWALGINLECGCFGTGSTEIGPWPILRNLSLMAALGVALWLDHRDNLRFPTRAEPSTS
ncbi:MAG: MauE/DoxX family redox-associated membrane protein [Polyangiaceae bacterium]